jgi:hypothetical protein
MRCDASFRVFEGRAVSLTDVSQEAVERVVRVDADTSSYLVELCLMRDDYIT